MIFLCPFFFQYDHMFVSHHQSFLQYFFIFDFLSIFWIKRRGNPTSQSKQEETKAGQEECQETTKEHTRTW